MIEEMLKGNSLGERHKHLNRLIADVTAEQFDDLFVTRLLQKCQLDLVFLAKVADRLRNAPVVYRLLKSDDSLVVSKVLKCNWFFEGHSSGDYLSPDNLMDDLFPVVSYSTRSKIITKLGNNLKDTRAAETLYGKLASFYGQEAVLKLLPACSDDFVRKELVDLKVALPILQMKYLYKRNPRLVIEHLRNFMDSLENSKRFVYSVPYFEPIFLMIAKDDPALFRTIYCQFHKSINFNLGYMTTVCLVEKNEEFAIKNALELYNKLNLRAVFDTLSRGNFDSFMFALFRERDIIPLLTFWKLERSLEYLIEPYKQLHNKEITEWKEMPLHYVSKLPSDLRVQWAKNMMAVKGSREEHYLKYLPADVAIKRYRELLKTASNVDERKNLLKAMFECCKINDDKETLLSVMKFTAQRYRNDASDLRFSVLSNLKDKFVLKDLSQNHWNVIDEMIQVMHFNKDFDDQYYWRYTLISVMEQKIEFNLNHGKEIESIVDTFIKYETFNTDFLKKLQDNGKKVVEVYISKNKPSIADKPCDQEVKNKIANVLKAIENWNNINPNNQLSVLDCDWLMDALKSYFNSDQVNSYSSILNYLYNDKKLRHYFTKDILEHTYKENMLKFYLKTDTNAVSRSVDTLIQFSMQNCSTAGFVPHYKKIHLYFNNDLGNVLREKLMEKVSSEFSEMKGDEQAGILNLISLLSNTGDFESFFEKYIPASTKLDPSVGDVSQLEYQRSLVVLQNFKNVNPPVSYGTLLRFAKDDYLKFVLPALLMTSFKRSERETLRFIEELSNSPVSVKKHSVRLSYFLFPKHMLIPFYEKMWNAEKNSSIRDVLFEKTFKMFTSKSDVNLAAAAWNLIKNFLQSFSEYDKNSLGYLSHLKCINADFIADFSEASWRTLKKLNSTNMDVLSKMVPLVGGFIEYMDYLSDEFSDTIVTEYFDTIEEDTMLSSPLLNFCIQYLMKPDSAEIQRKRIGYVCNKFKEYIVINWNRNSKTPVSRQRTETFVKGCCTATMDSDQKIDPTPVLVALREMTLAALPPGAVFDLLLCTELTGELIKIKYELGESFAGEEYSKTFLDKSAAPICDALRKRIDEHGPEFHTLFYGVFDDLLDKMDLNRKPGQKCDLIMSLLNHSTDTNVVHLAIDLLPESVDDKDQIAFQKVVKKIISNSNITLKMLLSKRTWLPSVIF